MRTRLLPASIACVLALVLGILAGGAAMSELEQARDRQNLQALEQLIAQYQRAAETNPQSPEAAYKLALAFSYASEVALENREKKKAEALAESGVDAAKKATSRSPNDAEYHRLLGELCGQVIPASPLLGGFKYGQCARDEVNKAIELDSKLALAYVSRGVGNFYLPSSMGGGVDLALKDFDKAISLDPNLAEAYLWKGVSLRKANRNADARQALRRALQLDPDRLWAKQQLDKTPSQ